MQNFVCRTTEYKRRIRSSKAFGTIAEHQPIENNDPLHYTFGDDVQQALKFNTGDFNDNPMEDIDKLYVTSDALSSINNDDGVQNYQNDQSNDDDDDDLCSLKSLQSEYSNACDVEDEVLQDTE
jgi:hypothetical protein